MSTHRRDVPLSRRASSAQPSSRLSARPDPPAAVRARQLIWVRWAHARLTIAPRQPRA